MRRDRFYYQGSSRTWAELAFSFGKAQSDKGTEAQSEGAPLRRGILSLTLNLTPSFDSSIRNPKSEIRNSKSKIIPLFLAPSAQRLAPLFTLQQGELFDDTRNMARTCHKIIDADMFIRGMHAVVPVPDTCGHHRNLERIGDCIGRAASP